MAEGGAGSLSEGCWHRVRSGQGAGGPWIGCGGNGQGEGGLTLAVVDWWPGSGSGPKVTPIISIFGSVGSNTSKLGSVGSNTSIFGCMNPTLPNLEVMGWWGGTWIECVGMDAAGCIQYLPG